MQAVEFASAVDESVAHTQAILHVPSADIAYVAHAWCINHAHRTLDVELSLGQYVFTFGHLIVVCVAGYEVGDVADIGTWNHDTLLGIGKVLIE